MFKTVFIWKLSCLARGVCWTLRPGWYQNWCQSQCTNFKRALRQPPFGTGTSASGAAGPEPRWPSVGRFKFLMSRLWVGGLPCCPSSCWDPRLEPIKQTHTKPLRRSQKVLDECLNLQIQPVCSSLFFFLLLKLIFKTCIWWVSVWLLWLKTL